MKRLLRLSTASISVSIVAVVLLAFGIFSFNQSANAANQPGKLITIHDRGEEKLLLSSAETIADALKDADITVDSRDAVEPALDEKLVATEYQINIYRARPVIVIDGATRQKIITPYQTPSQIVKDMGITLFPEDTAEITQSEDIITDGAGLRLSIDRATVFTFNLYGTKTEARTQGETVADMLRSKGIELEANDRVSLPLDTRVTTGLEVRMWREGKQTVTTQEAVPFDIEQIRDADQKVGYKEVRTEGQNGLRNVTYEIDIKDGVEVARNEIASIVTKPAVKQVEVVGVKVLLSVSYSADRAAIMTAAGVGAKDQDYAAYIINNENALWCPIRWQGTTGCGTEYYEKFPGAETSNQVGYGLCQSTPAIKMESAGADWRTNAVTQMKWCHSYAISRYGSWEAAFEAKRVKGWW